MVMTTTTIFLSLSFLYSIKEKEEEISSKEALKAAVAVRLIGLFLEGALLQLF